MSLKHQIDKIFKDNTDYIAAAQAVNQADSIDSLSKDLYTDSSRFIYELLQNADDSSVDNNEVKVWIKLFGDTLVLAHSGKSFDEKDIIGLCNINNGTKKSDKTKTGYKGIGFKSVFGQSDNVIVYTNNEYFKFNKNYKFQWKEEWGSSQSEWEEASDRKFQFPWQIIPIYTDTKDIPPQVAQYIKDCGANVATIIKIDKSSDIPKTVNDLTKNINVFLFLKNISQINFETTTININRTANTVELYFNDSESIEWIIYKTKLEVTDQLKQMLTEERNLPPKLLESKFVEVTLATKLYQGQIYELNQSEKILYSYLPTAESKYSLPVLANASFLTSANRETIHKDSKWNQWLFENIAKEIFVWISKLVKTGVSTSAYKLIPTKSQYGDELSKSYNEGIEKGTNEVAFVISKNNDLIKINESLIDYTYLSEKSFIGQENILNFCKSKTDENIKFAKNCSLQNKLIVLGAKSFQWNDFGSFLKSKHFLNNYSIKSYKELLLHLKKLCYDINCSQVTNEFVSKLPLIRTHKNALNIPGKVCIPTADDENWNNPNSELLFLHEEILNWVLTDTDTKSWLELLGIQEKTDITYINQIIIPNITSYITLDNAIIEIQKLFIMYRKNDLSEELIRELSNIKLLTQKGTLLQASKCYLADTYNPRLKIETLLSEDMFVSSNYCVNTTEIDEWKRFFKFLGVAESINTINYSNKIHKTMLIENGFNEEYFQQDELKFYDGYFESDRFNNISSLSLINYTLENFEFANEFWKDCITNKDEPLDIVSNAKAYWGYSGRAGSTEGNEVKNYLPWFIENAKCIPTVKKDTESSSEVYLNTVEIKKLGGEYISIFNGPELSQDWKSFFNFKTTLQLEDYLYILEQISEDTQEEKIKNKNCDRVQLIYKILLDACINWSTEEVEKVKEWSNTKKLLNTTETFTECSDLKYYIDGNESIFQEQYAFVKLSSQNKIHSNLVNLLDCMQIEVLRQDQFELQTEVQRECTSLKDKLNNITPYLKQWIGYDNLESEQLINLKEKISKLSIYQSNKLEIKCSKMKFSKSVNVHFNNHELYVTTPWDSNLVLLKLCETLCRYLDIIGCENKVDFLLRANITEIQQYFLQENIDFPHDWIATENDSEIKKQSLEKSDFHEESDSNFDKKQYIEKLIPRATERVIEHLKKLDEYDCSQANVVNGKSVILGIKKNGNPIAVVARPSDNEKIHLYYESEFDILEYADAELWYEDGASPPRQFTFGKLLKIGGINRISLKNIEIKDTEFNNPKSENLEFNAIPCSAEKTAQIIASFANTSGGTLIFGIKELSKDENEIVGLSSDFRLDELVKSAVNLLSAVPVINYGWTTKEKTKIYVIEVKKSDEDILIGSQKYVRDEDKTTEFSTDGKYECKLNSFVPEKTVVIIIAIEDYKNLKSVKYAVNDANKIKDMLIERMSVEECDIHMLLNQDALKSTLEYDLNGLFRTLTENDRLIFYYAGHGFHNGVSNCLSTYDTHMSNLKATSVDLDTVLLNPLKSSNCKNALIFIDACAEDISVESIRNNISNLSEDSLYVFAKECPYYGIFMSCQVGEKSYSCDELENGIWTYHLVEAMQNNVAGNRTGKYITDRSLSNYLITKVSTYASVKHGLNQNPKAILDASYETIITEV